MVCIISGWKIRSLCQDVLPDDFQCQKAEGRWVILRWLVGLAFLAKKNHRKECSLLSIETLQKTLRRKKQLESNFFLFFFFFGRRFKTRKPMFLFPPPCFLLLKSVAFWKKKMKLHPPGDDSSRAQTLSPFNWRSPTTNLSKRSRNHFHHPKKVGQLLGGSSQLVSG